MSEELKVKSEEYKLRKFGGITLISLVITIVVLIILSSIGIYLSIGNNGIFTRAKEAKETTNKQEATDIINLKITTAQMNKYAEKQEMPTLKELSEVLRYDNEIQYVTEKSQIASKKYEVGENPSSIYTKLNDYPYEFEINSSLKLASINGMKIANSEVTSAEWNKYMMNENGYVIGKEEITLPKSFKELYIKVNGMDGEPIYFFHFIYEALSDEKEGFYEGFSESGDHNACIKVSKTKLNLSIFRSANADITSRAKVEIWYK